MGYLIYQDAYKKHINEEWDSFVVNIELDSTFQPDSIEYTICSEKHILNRSESENSIYWSKKIMTPPKLTFGQVKFCTAQIKLIKNSAVKAFSFNDRFDCPDCDGTHTYYINNDTSYYKYSP